MPFIKAKVSCPLLPEQETELKAGMGKAIELVPGKNEEYLLLEFEDNCRLWLRGKNDKPIAYIEAAIFGNEMHYGYAPSDSRCIFLPFLRRVLRDSSLLYLL